MAQGSEIRSILDRISLLSVTSIVYNEHNSSTRFTRAGKKIQKVVKLCKNYDRPKQPASDARFTRQTPRSKRFENQKPSLRYKRARYYSAQLGRFISRDPLGFVDGMSLYRAYFVPNDLDPSGLACQNENCEDAIRACLPKNTDLISQIYFKGCTPPKFFCEEGECTGIARFQFRTNRVQICWKQWLKDKKQVENLGTDFCDLAVRHELTHALDNCHGINWPDRGDDGCTKRVCSEIRAWSASKNLCQYGEGRRRDRCLQRLIGASIGICGKRWNPATVKFDNVWKKCYVKQGAPLPPWPYPDDPESPWIPPAPPLPGEGNA